MAERRCENCTLEIEPGRIATVRFCRRRECKNERERKRWAKYRRTPARRWCSHCAAPLPTHTKKGTPRRICDSCKEERQRGYGRASRRRRYWKDPEKERARRMASYYRNREREQARQREYERANAGRLKVRRAARAEAKELRIPVEKVLEQWGACS